MAIEKITIPTTGFDWRTNIALIGGMAAKEVIVSTLGTAYSLGEVEAERSGKLSQFLADHKNWNPLKAFSLLIFIMLYMPCIGVIAVIKRETQSWKWAIFAIVYTTTLAFGLSTLVYQTGLLFKIGI